MNLAATLSLYAGGPGSGCNPAAGKCGRPSDVISDVNDIKDQHKATATLAERSGRVRIKDLNTPVNERGKGHASKLLSAITDIADKHGVAMELTSSPYGDEKTRLDHEQLKSFYQKHGFEDEPGTDPAYGYMIRNPKK